MWVIRSASTTGESLFPCLLQKIWWAISSGNFLRLGPSLYTPGIAKEKPRRPWGRLRPRLELRRRGLQPQLQDQLRLPRLRNQLRLPRLPRVEWSHYDWED